MSNTLLPVTLTQSFGLSYHYKSPNKYSSELTTETSLNEMDKEAEHT